MKLKFEAGSFLTLGLGRGAQIAGGAVVAIAATHFLSPVDLAVMSQLSGLASFAWGALLFPIVSYNIRHVAEWDRSDVLPSRILSLSLFILCCVAITFASVSLFQGLFSIRAGIDQIYVSFLVCFYVAAQSFYIYSAAALNQLGLRKYYIIWSNIAVWSGVILTILFSLAFGRTPVHWFSGLAVGLACGALAIFQLRNSVSGGLVSGEFGRSVEEIPRLSKFAGMQALAFVFWWALSQSYRFWGDGIAPMQMIGVVAACQVVTTQCLQALSSVLSDLYSPTFFRDREKGFDHYVSTAIPLIVLGSAFLSVAAPRAIAIMFGSNFSHMSNIAIITLFWDACWCIYNILYMKCTAQVKMRNAAIPPLIGIICTAIAYFLLGPKGSETTTLLLSQSAGYVGLMISSVFLLVSLGVQIKLDRLIYPVAISLPLLAIGYLCATASLSVAWSLLVMAGSGVYALVCVVYMLKSELISLSPKAEAY